MPIGNGGIIGPNNVPSLTSAKGVWSIQEAMLAQRAGTWPLPTPDNVDPFFYSVTSLLHGDGTNGGQNNTFLDSSSNNFTITRNGNTTQGSFSPFSQTGWSNYFSGSDNSYLFALNNTALSLPSGTAFTIEAWIYPTRPNNGAQSGFRNIVSKRVSNSLTTNYAVMLWFNSEKLGFYNGSTGYFSNANIPQNAWTHFAYVYDGGTSLKLYINGILDNTFSATPGATNSAAVWIGSQIDDTGTYDNFGGYISNLRIVKGSQVYTSNFTPSVTPLTAITNTSLLTCQSNRFIDNSANAFSIISVGTPSIQPFSPFNPTTAYSASSIGGSGYYDGSGDWITTPNVSAFDLSSSSVDFTIEAWVYNTGSGNYNGIIGARQNATGTGWCLYIHPNNTLYMGSVIVGNAYADRQMNTTVIPPNSWAHVALVKTSSGYTAYVNGVGGGLLALTGGLQYQSTQPVIVGALGSQGEYPFTGYITNARIVKGTAVYTSNFTPPTAPLTAIANTSLLCNFTNGAIFDNAAVADYETVGNAQISTSVKKYGTGSLAFDGTGDYLVTDAPSTQLMTFGTGDFTIEFWLYVAAFPSAGAYKIIYDSRPNSTQGLYPTITLKGSTIVYYTNSADRIASGSISATTWYHVALCRTASQTKLFINGTQVGSTYADTNSYINGASRPLIGDSGFTPSSTDGLNGYIDDLRVSKGVARYLYNFTPPTIELPNIGGTVTLTADPYYDYTTLLLPGNGTNGAQNNTFLDSSTNNFTITRNGNTTQGTFSPFSQTGWGNYFDGATATRLTMPSNTAFAFGTGAYTVEAWVYLTAHAATQTTVVDCGSATNSLNFSVLSTGALSLGVFGVGPTLSSAGGAVTLNTWNHVAVVRESTASNATKLYVNGTAVATGTDAGNYTVTTTPSIGGLNSSGLTATGYISNVRLVKGTAVYTSNFTPSTTPLTAISGTSLLTCQSNRFIDNGPNAFAITRNGNVSVQAFSPFNPTAAWSAATNGGSGYFDGSGDFLTAPSNAAFGYGTGDFTIEMWIYPTVISGSTPNIFDQRNAQPQVVPTIYINVGQLIYYTNGLNRITGATLVAGQWYHIAVCRASGSTRMFLNGVQTGSTYTDANNYINSPVSIFNQGTGGSVFQEGYCGDLRVVKGTALYTAPFTPPTAPLTAISGTSLLLNYTNAGIYDATSKNDLETVGNAQISTTQSKFGGSSMYFDGSGDYIVTPSSVNLQYGTGDFTIEFWWYPTTLASLQTIIYHTNDSGVVGAGEFVIVYNTSVGIRFYVNSGAIDITQGSTSGWSANNWYHVAVARYGNTLTIYRNGISVASGSVSGTTVGANVPTYIGGEPFDPFYMTGYIDDLRITKGIARYTSNFTPPTTAFLTL